MTEQGIPVERRIRAAMALAGLDFLELAKRIDQPGMKSRTLRKWASGETTPMPHHLRYIARACGVTPVFFSIDFSKLGRDTEDEVSELRERLEAIELQLQEARLQEIASDLEALRQAAGGQSGEGNPR